MRKMAPSRNVGCLLLCLVFYFLMISGSLHIALIKPPAIGTALDEASGAAVTETFMKGTLRGSYIVEGFAAGSVFMMGSFGLILLDRSLLDSSQARTKSRFLLACAGSVAFAVAYNLALMFVRKKIPGYMSN